MFPVSWEYKPVFGADKCTGTGRGTETSNLKQQHQEMQRVCRLKEENMSLTSFESDEFLVPC